jgi:hypothetical protein
MSLALVLRSAAAGAQTEAGAEPEPIAAPGSAPEAPALEVVEPRRPVASAPAAPANVAAAPAAAKTPGVVAPELDWTVGAGLISRGGAIDLGDLVSGPAYAAALERRLGGETWVWLNVHGAYERRDVPVRSLVGSSTDPNQPIPREQISLATSTATLQLGMRQGFIEGIVDASFYLGAFVGYTSVTGDELRSTESTLSFVAAGSKQRVIGLLAGMAVERELVEALALRLVMDLASASIVRAQTVEPAGYDGDVAVKRDLATKQVSLQVRPGLQLHFYF